ncbi:Hypothetical predicted protein [Paramuricea clavata]|uniref:Uncharacterized protein n=1 Tax=Paramuricea clavata TaxID=317549 RepID=A0A7D9E984_PARCT|nr:Hypothetical predicted protein [Paramuricea clavata]
MVLNHFHIYLSSKGLRQYMCECNYHQDLFQLEDVCKSQRALDHIKTSINKINKVKGKLLLNRKKELYGDNLEPKKWASNEIAFVQAMTAQTGEMLKESEEIAK